MMSGMRSERGGNISHVRFNLVRKQPTYTSKLSVTLRDIRDFQLVIVAHPFQHTNLNKENIVVWNLSAKREEER